MSDATRADICATACADAWRGDGEIVASPFGTIPSIGARLARATFSPDLCLSDGEASLVSGTWAVGAAPGPVESWFPYRAVFDLVWSGKRHVMMGPSQIDRFGNANLSAIGDFERPTRQLLGTRGAPGNTVNHATSYWVPKHSARLFVPAVDIVCGVGYGRGVDRLVDLRVVVTNLAVIDFATPDHSARLKSVHPGVSVDDVVSQTGFELNVDDVTETRRPEAEELRLIREVIDPRQLRHREIPNE